MEAMREFPDKYFDLAVVDPPYGIGAELGTNKSTKKRFSHRKGDKWDAKSADSIFFAELFRVSKNQILWGANHYISKIPIDSSCWIFWYKSAACSGRMFADGELAWTSFSGVARQFEFNPTANNYVLNQPKIHPTQKPIALYKWLLTNYAKPGDKILDTHLGSGSSRIAAYDMGFDFWGYELDKDYFEAMEKRFQTHISKPVLFAPDQMYDFEQTKLFEND